MMETWHSIRSEAEQLFTRHYERCVNLIPEINFSGANPQHLVSLCLYCSIIELCPSLLLLIKRDDFIGVPQLIRSMYEADIDLINASNDPDYFKSLHAGYLAKMIGIIQEAHESKAAGFMTATGGIEPMRAFLKEKRRELNGLKEKGHKPLQLAQRFKFAKRDEEYISAYSHLCGHSHNDIASLEARHLRKGENGEVKLVIFESVGPRDETHLIDLANTVLLGASGRTHRFFESGGFEEIDGMLKDLNTVRERWPEEKD